MTRDDSRNCNEHKSKPKMGDGMEQLNVECHNKRKGRQHPTGTRIQELEKENSDFKKQIRFLENERKELMEQKAKLALEKADLERKMQICEKNVKVTKESEQTLNYFKQENNRMSKEVYDWKIRYDKLTMKQMETTERLAESDRKATSQYNEVILLM